MTIDHTLKNWKENNGNLVKIESRSNHNKILLLFFQLQFLKFTKVFFFYHIYMIRGTLEVDKIINQEYNHNK